MNNNYKIILIQFLLFFPTIICKKRSFIVVRFKLHYLAALAGKRQRTRPVCMGICLAAFAWGGEGGVGEVCVGGWMGVE